MCSVTLVRPTHLDGTTTDPYIPLQTRVFMPKFAAPHYSQQISGNAGRKMESFGQIYGSKLLSMDT